MAHQNSQFFSQLTIAVASGSTVKDAADEVGCSLDHAYSLSRSAEFRTAVCDIRAAAVERAVGRLAEAGSEAVETLRDALTADRPADRINAAKAILGTFLQLSENLELRQRLADLEQAAREQAEKAEAA